MSMLYAPWRQDYVTKKNRPPIDGCLFCHIIALNKDEEQFIVKRYNYCVLMLNRYPYASGHLLIVPLHHGAFLSEFKQEALAEMMLVTTQVTEALRKLVNPSGFNVGYNMGANCGGSIPEHLHQHIIPRWGADLGFLELIGHTHTISINLREFYTNLKNIL